MAGNSSRRGAVRKAGTKKGRTVGSGGVRRRGLEGRGATPPAEMRTNHPAAKRAKATAKSGAVTPTPAPFRATRRRWCSAATRSSSACAPASPRRRCTSPSAPRTTNASPRASGSPPTAACPSSRYRAPTWTGCRPTACIRVWRCRFRRTATPTPTTCCASAQAGIQPALLVALDNISDPRNLGAVVRSVAAFGGHGVVIPQRRSASVTAVAWRTSAGAAARLPVARATNLTRTLKDWASKGIQVVGLDAGGDTSLDEYDGTGPVVVVVGSEGKGLSRLVRETCDNIVSVPMAGRSNHSTPPLQPASCSPRSPASAAADPAEIAPPAEIPLMPPWPGLSRQNVGTRRGRRGLEPVSIAAYRPGACDASARPSGSLAPAQA